MNSLRSKFPSNYNTLFDLLELFYIPAGWILFKLLKPLSPSIQRLEKNKKRHEEAMNLIEYLAQVKYYDFYAMGKKPEQNQQSPEQDQQPPEVQGFVGEPAAKNPLLHALQKKIHKFADIFFELVSQVRDLEVIPPSGAVDDQKREEKVEESGDDQRREEKIEKSGTVDDQKRKQNIENSGTVDDQKIQKSGDIEKSGTVDDQKRKQKIQKFGDTLFELVRLSDQVLQDQLKAKGSSSPSPIRDWNEPPLIFGAKMGLDDFVQKILQVCPQSATYLDSKGRNVLQVAIEHGNKKIVRTIRKMTQGGNPILPSWLVSSIDDETQNTILHFASEPRDTDDALQMQHQLRWFEMVKDMVPKELEFSRNEAVKTAEMFTESHKEMLKSGKAQIVEMGKTCSGILAAVVFATSFSIPMGGDKTKENNKGRSPNLFSRLLPEIFSHAYVIGLSFAATSLLLFLSLVISPYNEEQFRRAIPTKYFFACTSFVIGLMCFLVSFTCNISLQIHGGQRIESKDVASIVLELFLIPVLCFVVLFYLGSNFGPSFRRFWT